MNQYDYIIAGAGGAGLSLLMHLMQHDSFGTKKILVVDKEPKTKNDRTWCFWEEKAGLFEPVVHHSWPQVQFKSRYYSAVLDLDPYRYKMIRGIDFYNYVMEHAAKHPNVSFIYGQVTAIANEVNKAAVIINGQKLLATYVFNSILFQKPTIPPGNYMLFQHFKGWLIETREPVFTPSAATLMDFNVSQQLGTTFVYVLPLSKTKALVEYTLFTKSLLHDNAYNLALQQYIKEYLNIDEYQVTDDEYGVIPMTNINFERGQGNIVNIGTAGGQTKASSGYTFQFMQKQSRQIVQALLNNQHPLGKTGFLHKRFHFYDSTLLNILYHQKQGGDKIFSDLFRNNKAETVFRFLDNESTMADELKIITSVSAGVFVKAAMQEIFK